MSSSSAAASYTVLRIKRKATEVPLASLVIQDDVEARVKKRRDISGRARGVFRLAETVPHTWEGRGKEGEVLRTRIADLLSAPADSSVPTSPQNTPLPSSPPLVSAPSVIDPPPIPDKQSSLPPNAIQYRVISSSQKKAVVSALPPRILTFAEIATGASPLVFVDAQAVSSDSMMSPRKDPSSDGTIQTVEPALKFDPQEKEMAAFQLMLKEYLQLDQSSSDGYNSRLSASAVVEEYVYDLYYRDSRPEVLSGVAAMALGVGDGVRGVGALLGYEDLSPPASPSESEAEDEADEDSNDEDYYRNDYPEDEDADEDMEGYVDAGSDGEWSNDDEAGNGSEGEVGGNWDYR